MNNRVITIEATKPLYGPIYNEDRKRRAAAYCRVSTDSKDQENSYQAQKAHFENLLSSNPNLTYCDIYADEGKSGLALKKRKDFIRMMNDARAGKIDVIFVKSLSRFSRNTVDLLQCVRELKSIGVEVVFEKENLSSFDSTTELVMTIFGSIAQEESRSISENVKWGKREAFKSGKIAVPYKQFLGYEKGPDGLTINEEQAETVRLIYSLYLKGCTAKCIVDELQNRGIKSPSGKDKWYPKTVLSILTNEKYKGDAILQKTFVVDFLEKKSKVNEGEVPQYYVEGCHEAIIEPVEWELVQAEIERRKNAGQDYRYTGVFSSRVFCGECGCCFGSKVWHSTEKYRKVIYRCNHKYDEGKEKCATPFVDENILKNGFVKAYGQLFTDNTNLITDLKSMQKILDKSKPLQAEIDETNNRMLVIKAMLESDNDVLNDAAQIQLYAGLEDEFNALGQKLDSLQHKLKSDKMRSAEISKIIQTVKKGKGNRWDENLFLVTVDRITVTANRELVFRFKFGKEITVNF